MMYCAFYDFQKAVVPRLNKITEEKLIKIGKKKCMTYKFIKLNPLQNRPIHKNKFSLK